MAFFEVFIIAIILVISAIPLNLAVKFLRGRSTLAKAILVNLLAGLLGDLIRQRYSFIVGGLLSFIALLLIYRTLFELGWTKSLIAWVLQFIIAAIMIALLVFLGIIALF
ncbi:hypothetical protein GOV04_00185 [Candidatus Woesearchaeota archaeon]|nr:hypothetical protein [Candidatus Woesearchaeota archaeon]